MADRFLIAPFETGLELDAKPWLLPDDAFARLRNAYIFRGRVKKRFGTELTGTGAATSMMQNMRSKLAINLGNTSGVGFISSVLNAIPGDVTKFHTGAQFSIGNTIFTVKTAGAGVAMLTTDNPVIPVPGDSATFSTVDGTYSITYLAGAGLPCYFYPSNPVMGLTQYEKGPINDEPAFAFDTQFIYKFAGNRWLKDGPLFPAYFHGTNKDFFWAYNATGLYKYDTVLYVTNFYVVNKAGVSDATDDPIWFYNGTVWTSNLINKWVFLSAGPNAGSYILNGKMLFYFKNRLLVLAPIERDVAVPNPHNTFYPSRCRFSMNGSPLGVGAWLEENEPGYGGGGYIDASTEEEIIGAEFVKDRLIVFFESSTWEIAYTGNDVKPFIWQKLNTELGSRSTNSVVPFDKVVLAVGVNGICACNGSNVERIDKKIPDYVYGFNSLTDSICRVHGIRDYKTEMVYWSYPNHNKHTASDYPNTILVYNYKNDSWAENDDCITCWGYFEQTTDKTWADLTMPWVEANFSWNSYVLEANEKRVIAGNQHGYVFLVNSTITSNARVLDITEITYAAATVTLTIKDHNLLVGDFIKIYNPTGVVIVGNGDQIFRVDTTPTKDTIEIVAWIGSWVPGMYKGGGSVSRVSKIDIKSKEWNFYINSGRTALIPRVDFLVTKTPKRADGEYRGEITIDYTTNSSSLGLLQEGINSNSALGTNILETAPFNNIPLEDTQKRLWHSVFLQGEGEFLQLHIYFTDEQMTVANTVFADFELHGIMIYASPTRMSIGGMI